MQVTVGFPDGAAHQAESLRRNRPSPRAAILTKTGCQIAARSSTLISEILPPAFHHFSLRHAGVSPAIEIRHISRRLP